MACTPADFLPCWCQCAGPIRLTYAPHECPATTSNPQRSRVQQLMNSNQVQKNPATCPLRIFPLLLETPASLA